MPGIQSRAEQLWTLLADELDIAPSLYEKATARHESVGRWLCRPESSLAAFDPHVSAQGSFRYGTVIKPVIPEAEYDIDNIVVMRAMRVLTLPQAELMRQFGEELAGYAKAHGMQPPVPKRRCWRLHYRDEAGFHLDSLPCVPVDSASYQRIRERGVEDTFAQRAVAITDDTHPRYRTLTGDWLTSNPRGFAKSFELRAALGRRSEIISVRAGTVEPVPSYRWKTPLQRAIQILKRHRDVMFRSRPELAPISMIITNLAAAAYDGEQNVADALIGIVTRMGTFVQPSAPRVPNPTHPDEDYADKWQESASLETNFFLWLAQANADVLRLSDPYAEIDAAEIARRFEVNFGVDVLERLQVGAPMLSLGVAMATALAPVRLTTGPRPWGC